MAHLYNFEFDFSPEQAKSRSQYHCKKFKEAAERFGLIVYQYKSRGFSTTILSEETREYIAPLDQNIFRIYRQPKGMGRKRKSSTRNYQCFCGVNVRATKEVNIICGACGKRFHLVVKKKK
jgi:hypothetical protein